MVDHGRPRNFVICSLHFLIHFTRAWDLSFALFTSSLTVLAPEACKSALFSSLLWQNALRDLKQQPLFRKRRSQILCPCLSSRIQSYISFCNSSIYHHVSVPIYGDCKFVSMWFRRSTCLEILSFAAMDRSSWPHAAGDRESVCQLCQMIVGTSNTNAES